MSRLDEILKRINTSDLKLITIISINQTNPPSDSIDGIRYEQGYVVSQYFTFSENAFRLNDISAISETRTKISKIQRGTTDRGSERRIELSIVDQFETFSFSGIGGHGYYNCIIKEFCDVKTLKRIEKITNLRLVKNKLGVAE